MGNINDASIGPSSNHSGKSLGSGRRAGPARSKGFAPRIGVALLVAVAVVMTYGGGSESIAQDRNQGRSMVISRNGIVAAESP